MIDTLAALAARWRAKAMAELDPSRAHVLLDCAEDLEAAARLTRYTHLAGTGHHPGGLLTADPAAVTCPVCLAEQQDAARLQAAAAVLEPQLARYRVGTAPEAATQPLACPQPAEYTHLAGTPWHEEKDAERYPGRAASSDLAKVTCPACLGAGPPPGKPG